MKTYSAALTGWCSAVIAFDVAWIFTDMDAFEALFMAMMVGFVGAVAFLMITEKVQEKRSKKNRAVFVKDEQTNLEYMPMKKGKVA